MNKKQLAEQAKKTYDEELGKGTAADPVKLKSLKDDWETKQRAADEEEASVVTEKQLSAIIGKAVKLEIEGLKGQFDKVPDEAAIQAKVDKAVKAAADKKDVEGMVKAALDEALADCKRASKFGYSGTKDSQQVNLGTGGNGLMEISRGNIEYPCSWNAGKSNLPLHGMQLLNVMTTFDANQMNKGIDEQLLRRGEENGQKMLDSFRDSLREEVVGTKSWAGALEYGRKALAVATAGGANAGAAPFVAVELSSVLQRRLYLESAVATLFAAREIDQPVEAYLIPVRLNLPEFYYGALENTQYDWSDPGTAQPTLTARKLIGETQYSYEIDEASVIPMLPFVEEALAQGAAHGLERAIISGDLCGAGAAGTHMDFDVTDGAVVVASQPAEKLWNGLRRMVLGSAGQVGKVAGLVVNNGGAQLGYDALATMELTMGRYGLNPDALVWIMGPKGINRMKRVTQVQTAYSFGESRATIITGKIDRFDGIPVVPSQWMKEDVSANGNNTQAGPNTFGSCILVRPDRFLMGRRRTFTIEVFRQIWTQTNRIVASFRRSFAGVETPSAAISSVVVGVNWT